MCVWGGGGGERLIDGWALGRTGGGGSYNGSFEEFNLVLAIVARLPGRGGRIVELRSFGEMPKTLMFAALSPSIIVINNCSAHDLMLTIMRVIIKLSKLVMIRL